MIATQPHIQRKGKTVPYASANGYMFTFINKEGELGIRLSKEVGEQFIEEYKTPPFMSHGAKMKGYVLIPESLYGEMDLLSDLLQQGYEYVMSLKPK